METKNRRMATIFMACVTVVILSGLSCVWVWLLSDHHAPASRPVATVSAEQRNDAIREQSRAIAARKVFQAMTKAMVQQQAVTSTGATNWCQLFRKANEDVRLEQTALDRLAQMTNEDASFNPWLEVASCTRYSENSFAQTAYQIALDEISRVTAEDDEVFRAVTYDDWHELYLVTPVHSELEQFALVQMRETVETSDDIWFYTYNVL